MKRQKRKYGMFPIVKGVLLVLFIVFQTAAYAQGSPADEYYSNQLNGGISSSQLPSEVYYNNNMLRDAEPEPGGPGGGNSGGNGGVGTAPLGDGVTSLVVAILGYAFFLGYRRYRMNKIA